MTMLKTNVAFFGAALLGACASLMPLPSESVQRGRVIFDKECAQCHGTAGSGAGPASLGLGVTPPDLTGLTARNDGVFPRTFVEWFVLGKVEKEDPDAAMPEFGEVGFEHTTVAGTDIPASDMIALLDYLETVQK